jgi:hypothetical protein
MTAYEDRADAVRGAVLGGWTPRSSVNSVAPDQTTFQTVLRATCSSRQNGSFDVLSRSHPRRLFPRAAGLGPGAPAGVLPSRRVIGL